MKRVLNEFPQGQNMLRVCESEFKGKTYIDIRQWYRDVKGELQPTQKGVSIPVEHLDEVVKGIEAFKATN